MADFRWKFLGVLGREITACEQCPVKHSDHLDPLVMLKMKKHIFTDYQAEIRINRF
jgi:hypothetical protein